MRRFGVGDRVRIDIPDESDYDYERYHGREGEVIEISEDDTSGITGDPRDDYIYRVRFDGGEEMTFRWRDLRSTGKP